MMNRRPSRAHVLYPGLGGCHYVVLATRRTPFPLGGDGSFPGDPSRRMKADKIGLLRILHDVGLCGSTMHGLLRMMIDGESHGLFVFSVEWCN